MEQEHSCDLNCNTRELRRVDWMTSGKTKLKHIDWFFVLKQIHEIFETEVYLTKKECIRRAV